MAYRRASGLPVALLPFLILGMTAITRADQQAAPAAPTDEKTTFLRFVEDAKGGGTLQTAIATYKNDAGVTVHLVAAVHVGEKSYYQGLNKTFEGYDSLLYEMVKPRDADAPEPGQQATSAIGMFQHFLKDILELDFQLDDIDYKKPNFVHADLDAESFYKMQEARGESILGLMFQAMLKEMAKQDDRKNADMGVFDLLEALQSPDRGRQLKLMLAQQFGNIEDAISGDTVLITERNRAALKVMRKQIAAGKMNIGIFYGAGHMHDMEQRLEDIGFTRTGLEWRVSWDMTTQKAVRDHAREDEE